MLTFVNPQFQYRQSMEAWIRGNFDWSEDEDDGPSLPPPQRFKQCKDVDCSGCPGMKIFNLFLN